MVRLKVSFRLKPGSGFWYGSVSSDPPLRLTDPNSGPDPDPEILLFSSATFKMPINKYFFDYYFLKIYGTFTKLHNS